MSTPKRAKETTVGVQISKETGGAYADVREVIESELARIRAEWEKKAGENGQIPNSDTRPNDNDNRAR